jgi:hypothetical protein
MSAPPTHSKRLYRKKVQPIRIENNLAYIPLTKGYEAIIDAADVVLISGFHWHSDVRNHTVYSSRNSTDGGTLRKVYLHNAIFGKLEDMQIDHIDGNGLNNQRSNLRFATSSQNLQNTGSRKNNKSGLKGVSRKSGRFKWVAQIRANGKKIFLGHFDDPLIAHAAYLNASKNYHREFSNNGEERKPV